MSALTWWWGTYPEAGLGTPAGRGEGLWAQRPGGEAALALELPAPSFVVAHPDLPLLYAVSEQDDTVVTCVDVADPARPAVVGQTATGGRDGCHLLLSEDTLTLYVSHYSSGDLAVVRLAADGSFDSDAPAQLLGHQGSGPRQDRQEGPHAHSSGYAPGGRDLLVADLGTDELRRYAVLGDGTLRADGAAAALPPGAGPRCFAVVGDMVHVVCELDNRLRTLRWDPATRTAELVREQPATTVPCRSGQSVQDGHAVALGSGAGAALLVSVRGPNVLAVFDLDPEGLPVYRASLDSGGDWPRHFAVVGEQVVVGNERSHSACAFDLAEVLALPPEREPGVPALLSHSSARVPSPACCCPA